MVNYPKKVSKGVIFSVFLKHSLFPTIILILIIGELHIMHALYYTFSHSSQVHPPTLAPSSQKEKYIPSPVCVSRVTPWSMVKL